MKERKKLKKRRRSTLTLYLDRVADGDESYRMKLCKNLVDRLLYIPLAPEAEPESKKKSDAVTIRVFEMKYAGKPVVPIFTDEMMFNDWLESQSKPVESVTLMGADLCKVLPESLWLLVDYGSESEVILDEAMIDSIAKFGDQALEAEFGEPDIIELRETDIIELDMPLDEVAKAFESESATSTAPLDDEPAGLKGWLGV